MWMSKLSSYLYTNYITIDVVRYYSYGKMRNYWVWKLSSNHKNSLKQSVSHHQHNPYQLSISISNFECFVFFYLKKERYFF